MTLQQPLLIRNLRTDNHPPANEAMYLTTEVMSKMKMDVVEAVVSRVKNVTEIVVVSMMIHNVVSMRMILVGIVVSMLMINEVSMLMMNVASMMKTNVVSMMRMNVVSMMRTVVQTTMTVVSLMRLSLFLAVQKIKVLETMILMMSKKAGLLVLGLQQIVIHFSGGKNCWNLPPPLVRTLICQQHEIDLSSIISNKAFIKTWLQNKHRKTWC